MTQSQSTSNDETEYHITKKEACSESAEDITKVFVSSAEEVANNDMDSQLDAIIDGMSVKDNGVWQCKECCKTFNKKGNLKHHIESTHIEGISHTCTFCKKTTRSRHALNVHIQDYHHAKLSFSCEVCSKIGMSKRQFKQHKRSCALN